MINCTSYFRVFLHWGLIVFLECERDGGLCGDIYRRGRNGWIGGGKVQKFLLEIFLERRESGKALDSGGFF